MRLLRGGPNSPASKHAIAREAWEAMPLTRRKVYVRLNAPHVEVSDFSLVRMTWGRLWTKVLRATLAQRGEKPK